MAVSKVEPGKYLDQVNKKIYTVDHVKAEIVAVEDAIVELVDSVEELLKHLSSDAAKYAEKYYKEPFGSHGILLPIRSAHGSLWRITWRLRWNHQQKCATSQLLHWRVGIQVEDH